MISLQTEGSHPTVVRFGRKHEGCTQSVSFTSSSSSSHSSSNYPSPGLLSKRLCFCELNIAAGLFCSAQHALQAGTEQDVSDYNSPHHYTSIPSPNKTLFAAVVTFLLRGFPKNVLCSISESRCFHTKANKVISVWTRLLEVLERVALTADEYLY